MAAFRAIVTLFFQGTCLWTFFKVVQSEEFFVGNFLSNVSSDCQTNMWAAYVAIGKPGSLVGESMEIIIQPAGNYVYHLVEKTTTDQVMQDIYFQLGVTNTTSLPGNLTVSYVAQKIDELTLYVLYLIIETNTNIRATFEFGSTKNDFLAIDRLDPNIEGRRKYVRV